jgi:ribosomal protein L12E/L44/L45/RPP1/RPP2
MSREQQGRAGTGEEQGRKEEEEEEKKEEEEEEVQILPFVFCWLSQD